MAAFDPGDITIPGLPGTLGRVPGVPLGPSGPDDPLRTEALRWINGVKAWRRAVWRACGERVDGVTGAPLSPDVPPPHPDDAARARGEQVALCAADPLYEAAIWRSVHETRAGSGRIVGWQPAIPYPFQARYVRWRQWLLSQYQTNPDDPADGVVSKPRTMGVTTWNMIHDLWLWEHHPGFGALLVSKNADDVDSPRRSAMFSRVTAHYDWMHGLPAANPLATPRWLWPNGFEPSTHKTEMILRNPANGNELVGTATNAKKVGRSDRATIGEIDEAAYVDKLRDLLTAITGTVGFKVVVSSESDAANLDFGEIVDALAADDDPHLCELDYWMHPLYDEEWRAREEERYRRNNDPNGFAREILRDRAAGLNKWAYPESHEAAKLVRVGDFGHQPGAILDGAIDPGKADETVVGLWEREIGGRRHRLLDATADYGYEPEWWASVIAGYEDPAYAYTAEALRFIAVVRDLPPMRFLAGDPYGNTAQTSKTDTWYAKFYAYWAAHQAAIRAQRRNPDWRPPAFLTNTSWAGTRFKGRRDALRRLIRVDGLDVNDVPQARECLTALRMSKWRPESGRTSEQVDMPHDKWSHRRSMCEYRAANDEYVSAPAPLGAYDAATGRRVA